MAEHKGRMSAKEVARQMRLRVGQIEKLDQPLREKILFLIDYVEEMGEPEEVGYTRGLKDGKDEAMIDVKSKLQQLLEKP